MLPYAISSSPISLEFPLCPQTPSFHGFGSRCRNRTRYQTIRDLKIETPFAYTKHRDPEYGNEYLYLQVPAAKGTEPAEVRVSFEVTRHEHRVVLEAHTVTAQSGLSSPDLRRFLQPDHRVPLQGLIGELSAQETHGIQDPLAKARAIYNYVIATMRYDKSGTGWGNGDAIWACTALNSLIFFADYVLDESG